MKKAVLLLGLTLIFSILLVGCGQSNDSNNAEDIQTVHIVAKEWDFEPAQVEVKSGKVKLVIENQGERMHGFAIDELGIDESIGPNQTIEKVVTIDKPGDYKYHCTVLCGSMEQHSAMTGTLTVK